MKKVILGLSGILIAVLVIVLFANAGNIKADGKKAAATATEKTMDCAKCPTASTCTMAKEAKTAETKACDPATCKEAAGDPAKCKEAMTATAAGKPCAAEAAGKKCEMASCPMAAKK
jgi:hypothetical protein